MEVFSMRLKWLREQKGLSQKQMSELLEISQPYYFKFEKGNGQPNLETLAKLPDILDSTLDFLLGLTDFTFELQMTKDKLIELLNKMNRTNNKISDGITYINEVKSQINSLEFNSDSYVERVATIERTEFLINNYFKELEDYKDSFDFFKKYMEDHISTVPMVSEKTNQILNRIFNGTDFKNK